MTTRLALTPPQSSGRAVWKSRWPSWAPRPNEPFGFCGRKAALNYAYALVSVCPQYVNLTLSEDIKPLYIIIIAITPPQYVRHRLVSVKGEPDQTEMAVGLTWLGPS